MLLSLTGENKEESILLWDGSGDAVQFASGRKLHTCTEEAFSYTKSSKTLCNSMYTAS